MASSKRTMRMGLVISLLLLLGCCVGHAQQESRPIPIVLPPQLFIPSARLEGLQPWLYAPIARPTVYYMPTTGFNGSEGFGQYFQEHPDKFFSNFLGRNVINLPDLYVTRQMMVGNTLRLGKKGRVYLLSGILYGSQMGVMGNNWGLGTKEGILIRTKSTLNIVVWNQSFQSVMVYSPVIHPASSGDGAAVIMPATPEVVSFGVQASFVSGEFIIDIGASYRYK